MHTTMSISYDHFLASRVRNLKDSGIRKIFSRAATLEHCIDLSIGRTDFDVPEPLKASATRAIEEGFNRYTPTAGIAPLREGLRLQLEQRYGVPCESVIITSGVAGGLTLAFMALVEPGDEVLITDPYFIVHRVLVEQFGGVPVYVDTYPDFRLRREEIESRITDRTKIIVLNNPNNPTGVCYTKEELDMVADIASHRGLLILADEVYDRFDYDGEFRSILQSFPHSVVVSGFTKCYGMSGWRIGYASGPREIIDKMITLQQFTFVCPPAPFQKACAENLDIDIGSQMRAHDRKRAMVCDALQPRYSFIKPAGALYAYIRVPWQGVSGTEFVEACLDQSLLLVPGAAFSRRDTHFRLCFGAPDDVLREGLEILSALGER